MADLFNKLKQGLDKGVTAASVKSKEVIESTKLKSQIRDLQGRKREVLEELGNIVYTMFLQGGFDDALLREKAAALAALDNQIKQKEAEEKDIHIKAQEAMGKPKMAGVCSCGAELPVGAKFCGKCGRKTEVAPAPPPDAATDTCPGCGAALNPGTKFCARCGRQIQASS